MDATFASLEGPAEIDLYQEIESLIKKNPWAWQSVCAVIGLAGGVMAPILGAASDVITWFVKSGSVNSTLHVLSIVLCALTLPLLILGASCLDLLEAKTTRLSRTSSPPPTDTVPATAIRQIARQNDKHPFHRTGTLAVLLLLLALPASAQSQQTVLNAPITDVLPPCKALVELGVSTKPNDPEAKPCPNPSTSESELTQRAKLVRFGGEFSRKEYLSVRNLDSVRPLAGGLEDSAPAQGEQSQEQQKQQSNPGWQYGGFVDLAYPLDFNHPANHLFRSRGTAFRIDGVWLNMAGFYVRKRPTEQFHWGVELTAQAGKDDEFFGFSATAPNIAGHKFLRHLGPTNVSYLAPVGKGLTLQAGIFGSLIGYDSLYAKDNFNYTRPWGADFTPYFMMGANASYPFTKKLTGTFFVVNGYWHLARANSAPSAGGQIAYKLTRRVTLKETTLFGPHQRNTSFQFWRFLTDTIVERKTDKLTFAFEYIFSTERVDAPGRPRALMMSWQMPTRWTLNDRWSVAVRPEVFWDRDGRWTLARQTIKAFTSTLEYRVPFRWTNTIFRLEHRWDDSRGREGGFFRGREVSPGVVGLVPSQHLLIFATIFTFDFPAPR